MKISKRLTALFRTLIRSLRCRPTLRAERQEEPTGVEASGHPESLNGASVSPCLHSISVAESETGLENLPDDVMAKILSKLALQDPCSFLKATCAVKSFQTLASDRQLRLWERIVHGNAQLPVDEPETKVLEEVVRCFGGFEGLARARWEKRTSPENLAPRTAGIFKVFKARPQTLFLLLLRSFRGDLIMWSVARVKGRLLKPVQEQAGQSGVRLHTTIQRLPQNKLMNFGVAEVCKKGPGMEDKDLENPRAGAGVLFMEMYVVLVNRAAKPLYMSGPGAIPLRLCRELTVEERQVLLFTGAKIHSGSLEHGVLSTGEVGVGARILADVDLPGEGNSDDVLMVQEAGGRVLEMMISRWRMQLFLYCSVEASKDSADVDGIHWNSSKHNYDWIWERMLSIPQWWREYIVTIS